MRDCADTGRRSTGIAETLRICGQHRECDRTGCEELIADVSAEVDRQFQVKLEPEIKMLGEF